MQNDPRSLLTLTKRFIQIRKEHPALGLGTWTIVDSPAEGVLIMQYTYGQEKLLVVHNLSANKQVLKINQVGKKLINLLSAENTPIGQETITLTLEGYDYQWYQIR
jgi:maltose alpha-D-glucosyltransferase/alpha-amylase